ncbi:hypothetical protein LCGC14_2893730 [marine sediment metagenome]|uniref:Uncharacterized protein n=1 Tax=marine sediment metagenome TaxID=412755 RepID=A0A0F8XWH7_9ZZZZ
MYSDFGIQMLGLELTPVEVEAAAGNIKQYVLPVYAEIINWGVYITEDFVAQGTDPVVSINSVDKYSGTVTELDALTLGADNTKLFKGDGSDAEATVIALDTDLDNGHVVRAQAKGASRNLNPGDVISFRKKTAASGAGGAYIPWVMLKMGGVDPTRANVWHEKE